MSSDPNKQKIRIDNDNQRPGLANMSDRVITPRKRSVKTVVPCTLGKVCNWDTVDDNVEKREYRSYC